MRGRSTAKRVPVWVLVGPNRLFGALVGISIIHGLIILNQVLLLLKSFLDSLRSLDVAGGLVEVIHVPVEIAETALR